MVFYLVLLINILAKVKQKINQIKFRIRFYIWYIRILKKKILCKIIYIGLKNKCNKSKFS